MMRYEPELKIRGRALRTNMTDAERVLWSRLRRKQVLGIQFYRQRPLGPYIVDFYAPRVGLVIEVDGSQHVEAEHLERDRTRDERLMQQGIRVVRFSNLQVLKEPDAVMDAIFSEVSALLHDRSRAEEKGGGRNPPNPLSQRGDQPSPLVKGERRGDGGTKSP